MKLFRIGNNINIVWTIKKELSSKISKNSQISLLDKNNNKQEFKYTVDDNVITGTFYGKDQSTVGAYRLLLIENKGMFNQTVVDYLNAFALVSNLKSSTASNNQEEIDNADIYTVDVESFIGDNDLDGEYAKKSDIPTKVSQLENDSEYITQTNVPTKVSELENDSDYAITSDVDEKLSLKADKTEIPTKLSELTNDKEYVTSTQFDSLIPTDVARTEDIPTTLSQLTNDADYITSEQVDTKIANKADKTEIPTKVSQLENDKGYLTEHQSLSNYATKEEIPTKVSQLSNDKGYLTDADIDLTPYAKKTQLPTKVSELLNDKGYIADTDIDFNKYATKTYVDDADKRKFDNVKYNSSAKTIDFYVGDDVKASIDATDFIKDGMIDTVTIDGNNNLTITFNTDAGKEPITIALGSVFVADNYYTKTQADSTFATKSSIPTVPTKVSELTNDANYITSSSVPTKTSQLTNDSNFLTPNINVATYVSKEINAKGDLAYTSDVAYLTACLFKTKALMANTLYTEQLAQTEGSSLSTLVTYTCKLPKKNGTIALTSDIPSDLTVPTKLSELTNDTNFITSSEVAAAIPTDYVKQTYVDTQDTTTLTSAKTYTDTSISSLTWKGTQAEYDALTSIDDNVIYFIKES